MMCRPSATSAGDRSRAAGADQQQRPDGVDRGGHAVDRQGRVQGCSSSGGRCPVARQTSARISSAATHDQHAFQHGGEILRLVVAERVVVVGRLVADADRPEGGRGGDHVDDRFQRVGIERDRAGHPPGERTSGRARTKATTIDQKARRGDLLLGGMRVLQRAGSAGWQMQLAYGRAPRSSVDRRLRTRRGDADAALTPPFPWPCAADARRCSRSCACRRSGRAS